MPRRTRPPAGAAARRLDLYRRRPRHRARGCARLARRAPAGGPSLARARDLAPDPLVFGLAWPLFGLAAILSVAAAARYLAAVPRRRLWAAAQGIMALGTALPLLVHALWAVAASAVLVGGTFMVATMAGLQLAREARPDDPTPLLARMTAAFAAGQIAGPLLVRALGSGLAGWDALSLTGAVATLLLVLTALWLWRAGRVPV
ncbi:YbfB/YjiJ family MFS transporter [Methylobacterium nonmethylotrophicum]|uniref:YbfB/YjiJ family MFS transporter n=1 Tax=Methylobacterium nonmethylotrophicum TaxID=1141884 RepID=UPI001FE01F9B|nr:YbfB/YjiJ family MFS transporter [Methylobacterium nonmethylotrophicum]